MTVRWGIGPPQGRETQSVFVPAMSDVQPFRPSNTATLIFLLTDLGT